jgi:hypothetical protein
LGGMGSTGTIRAVADRREEEGARVGILVPEKREGEK